MPSTIRPTTRAATPTPTTTERYMVTTTSEYYGMESNEVDSEYEAGDIKEEEKPDNWCDNWPWCFYKN